MPLLSHDHLSRLHCHSASCSLTANQHASEAVICCDTIGNPSRISIKCWSMLFLPIKTGWAARQRVSCSSRIARQQRLYAAAALGRTRRELRSCVLWNTSGRAEPWGARLWPASSPPDKESSLQLFLPASYSSSPPLHGHWTNPELLEGTLHITCYAAVLNAA